MTYGDFVTYPWGATSAGATFNYHYTSSSTPYYITPTYYPPAVEMPEGPMEWLRRRVTEITDLAYAA